VEETAINNAAFPGHAKVASLGLVVADDSTARRSPATTAASLTVQSCHARPTAIRKSNADRRSTMLLPRRIVVRLRRKAPKSKLKNDRPIAGCWANLQQLVHLLAAAPWNLDPRVGGACRPAGPTSLIASHQSASRDEPEQIATPPALFALACTPGTRPSARAGAPREEPTT